MSALEKAAWMEFVVSVAAVVLVAALFPWLHDGAMAGFALLGLSGLAYFFVHPRRNQVVVDERDREIDRRAIRIGVTAAWITLSGALIGAVVWAGYSGTPAISTRFLSWLLWAQCALCYGTKGLVAVVLYRRQQVAA